MINNNFKFIDSCVHAGLDSSWCNKANISNNISDVLDLYSQDSHVIGALIQDSLGLIELIIQIFFLVILINAQLKLVKNSFISQVSTSKSMMLCAVISLS